MATTAPMRRWIRPQSLYTSQSMLIARSITANRGVSQRSTDFSLNQWMKLKPPELVESHLANDRSLLGRTAD
jgi:hypothetical protein